MLGGSREEEEEGPFYTSEQHPLLLLFASPPPSLSSLALAAPSSYGHSVLGGEGRTLNHEAKNGHVRTKRRANDADELKQQQQTADEAFFFA